MIAEAPVVPCTRPCRKKPVVGGRKLWKRRSTSHHSGRLLRRLRNRFDCLDAWCLPPSRPSKPTHQLSPECCSSMTSTLRKLLGWRSSHETLPGGNHHSQGPSLLDRVRSGNPSAALGTRFIRAANLAKSHDAAVICFIIVSMLGVYAAIPACVAQFLPLQFATDAHQSPRGFDDRHPAAEVHQIPISHHKIRLGRVSHHRPLLQLPNADCTWLWREFASP
jgi:hypothetical protein